MDNYSFQKASVPIAAILNCIRNHNWIPIVLSLKNFIFLSRVLSTYVCIMYVVELSYNYWTSYWCLKMSVTFINPFKFMLYNMVAQMCQKSKSSIFLLIFWFLMKSYPTDSIFSPIRWYLGVAISIFVFTK